MESTPIQPVAQLHVDEEADYQKLQPSNTTPVLPTTEPKPTRSWRHYAFSPIAVTTFAELELLLLTFNIGMQDATTFPDYRCFTSNQTGNTIMLAIAMTMQNDGDSSLFIPANIGVSLPMFIAGSFLTGQLGHRVYGGPRMRAWLVATHFLQTAMVFCAAAMQFKLGNQPHGAAALGIIALLAFSSGSQVVLSRALNMTEISTAMATAAWVDLMVDANIWKRHNRPRNRRAFFLLSLFAGGSIGAVVYRNAGSTTALLLSGAVKAVVTGMLLFNPLDK